MCKEMTVIPVNRVVDKKRIIGKNGGLRRRRSEIFELRDVEEYAISAPQKTIFAPKIFSNQKIFSRQKSTFSRQNKLFRAKIVPSRR
jgi:hypothetical protein